MSPDVVKIILGTLRLRPNFLEIVELDERLFSTDRERQVFRIIAKEWEDKRPAEIDPVLLAEKLGGDGAFAFVSSLTDGLQHLSPETFIGHVDELKESIIVRRLSGRLQKETSIELKTGTPMDLTEILRDVDELRQLRQAKKVNVVSLETIEPKSISWLWPGRIPRGMLTLCCGDPGVGKSFCSIALASKLSRGIPLPDSHNLIPTCSTLFILGEDPLSEAVRPRANANGADCSKIHIFQEEFHLTDTAKLRWIFERNKDIGLIIIDPLTGFFPARIRYFEDPSVRAALLPLASFAEESGVAVLAIAHFRKAEAEAAIHKVAGSIGLAGIARSILAVTRDDDDPDRRLLTPLKANYSRRPAGLAFRIIGDDIQAKIVFEDKPIEADAEDALRSNEQREAINERKFNARWLLDFLKGGPKTIKEIVADAPFARPTMFRLADKLEQAGKIERVPGTEGCFKIWRLPG